MKKLQRTNNVVLGATSIVIGMTTSSVMDATIKSLSGGYPLHEIVMVRSVVAILLTLVIVHYQGGLKLLNTPQIPFHLFRGVLIVIANMSFYLALSVLPLAETTALFFVSPLIITALSVPFLGEKVGWRRWFGVAIGFIGVLIIARPGAASFSYYSLLPIIAASAYASSQIAARKMGTSEKPSVMSFYIMLAFIVVSTVFLVVAGDGSFLGRFDPGVDFLFRPWVWPDNLDAGKMLLVGALVTVVGFMLNQAYSVADASVVAPFEYVALPLAAFWGYLFWDQLPDWQTGFGIFLIAFGGLYVFIREKNTGGPLDAGFAVELSDFENKNDGKKSEK